MLHLRPDAEKELREKLPKMEYTVPGTRNLLEVYFRLRYDDSSKLYIVMGMKDTIHPEEVSFFCEEYIPITDKRWFELATSAASIEEKGFTSYVLSRGNELEAHFRYRCKRVPWEMGHKICYSIRARNLHVLYDVETNECTFFGRSTYQEKYTDQLFIRHSLGGVAFKSHEERVRELRSRNYHDDPLDHFMRSIICYAGARLNPRTMGDPKPMSKAEMKALHKSLREYTHIMEQEYAIGTYAKHEASFYPDQYERLQKVVNNKVLEHIDASHKGFWKKKHEEILVKANMHFQKIQSAVTEQWWLAKAS